MLVVGVTATRSGLTGRQAEALARILSGCWGWEVVELRHGDCVGGDADADAIAAALGIRRVSHPPDNPALRAFCAAEEVRTPEPYLTRNRAIVRQSWPLLALPASAVEQKYGGTWGTVRYARETGRALTLIYPDGTTASERYKPDRI